MYHLIGKARNHMDIDSANWTKARSKEVIEWANSLNLTILEKRKWFIRPELIRLGLRPIRAPWWVPDCFVTGVDFVLRKG